MAEQNLAIGSTVVVDAVNAVGEAKTFWMELARRRGARLLAVEVVLPDADLHRRRLAERVREFAFAEPTWEAVRLRREEWVAWPFAPLVVDSSEALALNVAKVLEAARTIIAERPADDAGAGGGPESGGNLERGPGLVPGSGDNETPEGTPGP